MSPRAACRLESLGFTQVYDYVTGLADWTANGLPTEGRLTAALRAGDAVRRDVPVRRLGDRLGDVTRHGEEKEGNVFIVTSEDGVVLGRLRGEALQADPDATVGSLMESGPTTIRPDVPLEEFTDHMRARRVDSVVVTTSTGHLIGVLYRRDAEERLRKRSSATSAS